MPLHSGLLIVQSEGTEFVVHMTGVLQAIKHKAIYLTIANHQRGT